MVTESSPPGAPDCQLNSTSPCPQVKGLNQIQLAARSKPHLTITVLLQPVVEPGTFLAALSEE
jgi:hypothetical protein